MESNRPPTIAKKLWHIFEVVYYMLRKGMPKSKLMMDLHLLLKRGKIASKALASLMSTFHSHHHHHHHHRSSSSTAPSSSAGTGINGFSCRSMDPNLSFYDPREVEFSCSSTPSLAKRSSKNRHHHRDCDYEAAAAIARAFDILNTEAAASAAASDAESGSVAPSPMKTPFWRLGRKSPAAVRQLRVTDSPFPIKEEEAADEDCAVDKEAEEFIRRFYEQLRRQQTIAMTPDYYRVRRG